MDRTLHLYLLSQIEFAVDQYANLFVGDGSQADKINRGVCLHDIMFNIHEAFEKERKRRSKLIHTFHTFIRTDSVKIPGWAFRKPSFSR